VVRSSAKRKGVKVIGENEASIFRGSPNERWPVAAADYLGWGGFIPQQRGRAGIDINALPRDSARIFA
jgi:hypothetical protein